MVMCMKIVFFSVEDGYKHFGGTLCLAVHREGVLKGHMRAQLGKSAREIKLFGTCLRCGHCWVF
jgi:hypothetical protein